MSAFAFIWMVLKAACNAICILVGKTVVERALAIVFMMGDIAVLFYLYKVLP